MRKNTPITNMTIINVSPFQPAKTIHVSNIPTYFCTYNRFMSLLGSYSEIQYVNTLKVFHNKAFVEFSTRDEANYALHLLEGKSHRLHLLAVWKVSHSDYIYWSLESKSLGYIYWKWKVSHSGYINLLIGHSLSLYQLEIKSITGSKLYIYWNVSHWGYAI